MANPRNLFAWGALVSFPVVSFLLVLFLGAKASAQDVTIRFESNSPQLRLHYDVGDLDHDGPGRDPNFLTSDRHAFHALCDSPCDLRFSPGRHSFGLVLHTPEARDVWTNPRVEVANVDNWLTTFQLDLQESGTIRARYINRDAEIVGAILLGCLGPIASLGAAVVLSAETKDGGVAAVSFSVGGSVALASIISAVAWGSNIRRHEFYIEFTPTSIRGSF